MFFSPDILRKGHSFFPIWIAATQQGARLRKYLPIRKVREVHLAEVANEILKILVLQYPPSVPRSPSDKLPNFSLRLTAQLMYGSCVVLNMQAALLFDDVSHVFLRIKNLRWSEDKGDIVKSTSKIRKEKDHLKECLHPRFNGDEPLVFPHTVPENQITLVEYVSTKLAADNEDQSFGDNSDILLGEPGFWDLELELSALMDTTPHGQEGAQIDVNVQEQLSEQDFNETSQPALANVPSNSPPDAAPLGLEGIPHESAKDLHMDWNDEIQQESLQQGGGLETHSVGAIEPEPAAVNPVETMETQEGPPQPETNVSIEPSLPIASIAAETNPLEDINFFDKLPEIDVNPRRPVQRGRPTHLIIDDVIEIPSATMRARIQDGGKDTLRKESAFHDYLHALFIRKRFNLIQMTQPGLNENLHKSLLQYFYNALVTNPAPNVDFPVAPATIRLEPPHPLDEHAEMRPSDIPDHSVGILEEPHPETLMQLPETQALSRPRFESIDLDFPIVTEMPNLLLHEQLDSESMREAPIIEISEPTIPKSPIENFGKRSLPAAKTHGKRPRVSSEDVSDTLRHQNDNPPLDFHISLTQAETSARALPQMSETAPLVDEIFQDLENEPLESRGPIFSEDVPLPHQQIFASPSFNQQEVSITSPSQNPILTASAVLNQLNEIETQGNEEEICIHHLCKPGVTKRKTAAEMFGALLALRQGSQVILKQEYVGESPQPVTVKSNPLF